MRTIGEKDPLFSEAVEEWRKYGQNYDKITASFFQRRLDIGYARAERLVNQLREAGIFDMKSSDIQEVPYSVRKLRELDGYAKKHPIAFTMWLIGAGIALFFGLRYFLGVEQVGHFFEKDGDYKTIQYVNLFEQKDLAKNYRLRAKVWRVTQDSESPRSTLLQEVYFPNGGSISFEDSDCNLELNTKVSCGSNGSWWFIELTDQKP